MESLWTPHGEGRARVEWLGLEIEVRRKFWKIWIHLDLLLLEDVLVDIFDLAKLFIIPIINFILVIVHLIVVPVELVLIVILLNTALETGLIHALNDM